ncbi:Ulp1 protease family, C-terminal catalytic domain [Sesbania bispinosa]|nr:Ulp1 protease family, C-terminal catalytic domain [Sesbania bispinosa]
MENKMEKVIGTIDTLAKMIPAFQEGNIVEESIGRSPNNKVERILKKLSEGEKNVSGKKVFSSPISAKSRGMVFVTTSTASGYYLNPTNKEEIKDQETLIGEFVPQCLKDIFKPIYPITLFKVEAAVASYIFCHSMKENIDRKEILVRTKLEFCEEFYYDIFMGKVDLLNKVFIPMNDDNYHWYLVVIDFINKEAVYLDSFPSQHKREARLRSVHTVTKIALDLALNPGNVLQEEIVDRALDWFESLPAGGGDHVGTGAEAN